MSPLELLGWIVAVGIGCGVALVSVCGAIMMVVLMAELTEKWVDRLGR